MTHSTRLFGRSQSDVKGDRIAWNKHELKEYLLRLWSSRERRWIVMPYNVRVARMIGALRRHFDYQGWVLHTVTNSQENEVAISIRQRHRGARPSKAKGAA